MNLTPQHKKILEIHSNREWHCSTEIEYIRDQRKRISELNAGGYTFDSRPCDRRCGRIHSSRLYMRRLTDAPIKYETRYVEVEIDGERFMRMTKIAV